MTKKVRDLDDSSNEVLQVAVPLFPPGNSDFPFYTVSQVAKLLNVQPAFLRRLDTERVVSPGRSEGRQRRYSQNDMSNVQRTVELVSEGMTLAGIHRLLLLEAEIAQLRAELAFERAKATKRRR